MLKVLRRLHEQRLQVDIDKCEFLTKRDKYLGNIVIIKGINIIQKDPGIPKIC